MLTEHKVIYIDCMVFKTQSSTPNNTSARTTTKWNNNFVERGGFTKFSQVFPLLKCPQMVSQLSENRVYTRASTIVSGSLYASKK